MEFILEIPFSAKYLTSFSLSKCLNIVIVITNRLDNYYVFRVVIFFRSNGLRCVFSLQIHKSWMLKLKRKPIKKRSCTPNTVTQLHFIRDFLRKSEQYKYDVQVFAGGSNLGFGLWENILWNKK